MAFAPLAWDSFLDAGIVSANALPNEERQMGCESEQASESEERGRGSGVDVQGQQKPCTEKDVRNCEPQFWEVHWAEGTSVFLSFSR